MSALGVPTDVHRRQPLTRFQFYLGLVDALAWKRHSEAPHLKELADSFGHDVLNLAALGGRLLWYEGVTPEMWRSHGLIAVSVDVESYYVMLQSACDIMADVVATLGVKKGQAPWESFHRLNQWALKNPDRLAREFRLVATQLPWFDQINSKRTDLVHRGKTVLVYTDRVSFNWGKLLPSLRELTSALLKFSEHLGHAVLSEMELGNCAEKRVIDGVYVPALHHLLHKYKVPEESSDLNFAAQCLLVCGGYVEAGYIGYPDGFWWTLLLGIAKRLKIGPFAGIVPVGASGFVHDCKFLFSSNGKRCGFLASDRGESGIDWLKGAAKTAQQLKATYSAERIVFIVRRMEGTAPGRLPDTTIPLIVEDEPTRAAERISEVFAT